MRVNQFLRSRLPTRTLREIFRSMYELIGQG